MMEDHRSILEREGFLLIHTKGISMEPMLRRDREQSLIRPLTRSPRRNDVILFRRSAGVLVLHRVVGKRGEHYLLRGDNSFATEAVHPSQMLGRLEGYYSQDRYNDIIYKTAFSVIGKCCLFFCHYCQIVEMKRLTFYTAPSFLSNFEKKAGIA